LFAEGRYEETLAGVEHIGAFAWDNMYALACYAHLGKPEQAWAMLARLKQQGRQPDWNLGLSREPYRDRSVWNQLRDGLNAALSF
jgi:pentatricopeptide repeat protein